MKGPLGLTFTSILFSGPRMAPRYLLGLEPLPLGLSHLLSTHSPRSIQLHTLKDGNGVQVVFWFIFLVLSQ